MGPSAAVTTRVTAIGVRRWRSAITATGRSTSVPDGSGCQDRRRDPPQSRHQRGSRLRDRWPGSRTRPRPEPSCCTRLAEDIGINPHHRRVKRGDHRRRDSGPRARKAIGPISHTPTAPAIDCASLTRPGVASKSSRPAPTSAEKGYPGARPAAVPCRPLQSRTNPFPAATLLEARGSSHRGSTAGAANAVAPKASHGTNPPTAAASISRRARVGSMACRYWRPSKRRAETARTRGRRARR